MKIKIITTLLVLVFLTSSFGSAATQAYTNHEKGSSTITIDGAMGDWVDIDSVTVTLKPARVSNDANASFTADFYSTHDAAKIYFLIVIKDDPYLFYNMATGISHRTAPALGLAFPIDDGAIGQN